MNIRAHVLRIVHKTWLEHFIRKYYQYYKWNCPDFFLTARTQLDMAYDRETIEFAKQYLQPGMVAMDIGANSGSILSRLISTNPDGIYLAYEPLPYLADYLRRKFPQVNVVEIGLSDTKKEVDFFTVKNSPALSSLELDRINRDNFSFEKIKIRVDTFDNLNPELENLVFIKIDVEGHEIEVIRGALKSIERNLPAMVIEVSPETEWAIRNLLRGFQYRIEYLLSENRTKKLKIYDQCNSDGIGKGYLKVIPFGAGKES